MKYGSPAAARWPFEVISLVEQRAHTGGYYSPLEEWLHAGTHGLGVLLATAGLVVLVVQTYRHGDAWAVTSVAIYGGTLVLLYLASTVYHAVTRPRAKHVLKQIDHAAIYLLIAGTYTPFCLGPLRGPWGWTLFGVAWGLALAGATLDVATNRRFRWASLTIYLGMSWLIVSAIKPMLQTIDGVVLIWLLAGGLFYTGGVVFYVWRRLPFHHTIWHVFVLAGSACHWIGIFRMVVPS